MNPNQVRQHVNLQALLSHVYGMHLLFNIITCWQDFFLVCVWGGVV